MGVPSGIYYTLLKYKTNEKMFKDFKLSNNKCLVITFSTLCMVKLSRFIEKNYLTLVHSFYHGTNVTTYSFIAKISPKSEIKT
jgi:hypothetical protein